MLRIIPATAVLAACALVAPSSARADEPASPAPAATAASSILRTVLASAWEPSSATTGHAAAVAQTGRRPNAGPNIGAVGLGAVAGLSDFELGPSFRYWINERFGVQAHLGFGGEDNFRSPDDVKFMRFEPTFIVAIGDFGNAALNVRPYAGGGLRLIRTDFGDFSDTDLRPAGVGGVEFGFRGAPRLKVSTELSLSTDPNFEGFNFDEVPTPGGARLSALLHYFFE